MTDTTTISLHAAVVRACSATLLLLLNACSGGSSTADTADVPAADLAAATTPAAATPDGVLSPDVEPGAEPETLGEVSPVRRIDRRRPPRPPRLDPRPELGDRTIDGSNNNLASPGMGGAGSLLIRLTMAAYSDGVSTLAGVGRPNARAVSNAVAGQTSDLTNPFGTTDFLWQWGQFVDHDIDLTDGVDPAEPANIEVPAGDPWFDPDETGDVVIPMNRSIYETTSSPREQLNEITAWIDASNVYGSEEERARALRTLDGTGELKMSDGDLLPFNIDGLANAGGGDPTLFLAGDVRANEQTGLAVMHTLFVREHNRLARIYADRNPNWSGDEIYQKARQIVGAEMQSITYREFLPALLGANALGAYAGYDDSVEAGIANEFAHAAYRLGHSMLSEFVLRLEADGSVSPFGHLALRDAFFQPGRIANEGGIEPVLRGLAGQRHQRIDTRVVDDVRNFLFGQPGAGGFDLASLNLQRGRDHGLGSYNDVREALGLGRKNGFWDISSDVAVVDALASVYDSVDDIDLWVGGLAENPVDGGQLGELFRFIVVDQFRRLRDGDRYWYERTLTREERDEVEDLRLSDIIRLNTAIGTEIQNDVFHAEQP